MRAAVTTSRLPAVWSIVVVGVAHGDAVRLVAVAAGGGKLLAALSASRLLSGALVFAVGMAGDDAVRVVAAAIGGA